MNKKNVTDINMAFPSDPFSAYFPTDKITFAEAKAQKVSNYNEMLKLANQFSGDDRLLIRKASFLAIQCHFSQFRGGRGFPTYSMTHHLLEVAKRFDFNYSIFSLVEDIGEAISTALDKKAIGLSIALLHDCIEDFHENFRQSRFSLTQSDAQILCYDYLLNSFEGLINEDVALFILKHIDDLTISNPHEFPDREYIDNLKTSPISHMVKLADIDHNLTTFKQISPEYPCLVIPFQLAELATNTAYEKSFSESLLLLINEFNPDALASWLPPNQIEKTTDRVLNQVKRYDNFKLARTRLNNFYKHLKAEMNDGVFDNIIQKEKLNTTHLQSQIDSIVTLVATA